MIRCNASVVIACTCSSLRRSLAFIVVMHPSPASACARPVSWTASLPPRWEGSQPPLCCLRCTPERGREPPPCRLGHVPYPVPGSQPSEPRRGPCGGGAYELVASGSPVASLT